MKTIIDIPFSASNIAIDIVHRGVKPAILVADDEPAIRNLSSLALDRAGYRVDQAENGLAALRAVRTDSYDLLITDLEMPVLSGMELVAQLRSEGMILPVILISGSQQALNSADEYEFELVSKLEKPYGVDTLLSAVHDALQSRSSDVNRIRTALSSAVTMRGRFWGINE